MLNAIEVQKEALQVLQGHWKKIAFIQIMIYLCTFIAAIVLLIVCYNLASLVYPYLDEFYVDTAMVLIWVLCLFIVVRIFNFGSIQIAHNLANNQTFTLGTAFSGFHHFFKCFGLGFIIALRLLLWATLFIVPAFVMAYRYRMAICALSDDPTLSIHEALNTSKRLTKHHKKDMVMYDISFTGWNYLESIGMVWLGGYRSQALYMAYENYKQQAAAEAA